MLSLANSPLLFDELRLELFIRKNDVCVWSVAVLSALLFVLVSPSPSVAKLTFQPSKSNNGDIIVIVKGNFERGESLTAFTKVVKEVGATVISFDSGGGNVAKALALGREIRRLRLSTIQPRALECASACALAFMGGVNRFAEPGAIGVHKFSFASEEKLETDAAVSAIQDVTADIVTYMIEMGVEPALLRLSFRTEANDMRYLSGREMQEFNLTHSEPVFQSNTRTIAAAPSPKPTHQPPTPSPTRLPGAAMPEKERAIFYQEGNNSSGAGTASQGEVVWSLKKEADLEGIERSVLLADIQIPEMTISVYIRIKPNDDDSLPASHLVEVKFDLPNDFVPGDVINVPGLVMKPTEEARGDALIGASVKVSPSFFWIALSSLNNEHEKNMALLKERGWIDIPFLYENGKRGILTLEKGVVGSSAVEKAISDWVTD
jgi:hypothetical protein